MGHKIAIWHYFMYTIMKWQIRFNRKTVKAIKKLPYKIQAVVQLLTIDLQINGPALVNWPNYGKLKGKEQCFHCHLVKNRPRYVACWEIIDRNFKYIEIYYVGTHEKAPY